MKLQSFLALLTLCGVAQAQTKSPSAPSEQKKFSWEFSLDLEGVPTTGWGVLAPDGSTRKVEELSFRPNRTPQREDQFHSDAGGKLVPRVEMLFANQPQLTSYRIFDGSGKLLEKNAVTFQEPASQTKPAPSRLTKTNSVSGKAIVQMAQTRGTIVLTYLSRVIITYDAKGEKHTYAAYNEDGSVQLEGFYQPDGSVSKTPPK